jgi:FlaA1/EpsC-like NDP-sugar epimerase
MTHALSTAVLIGPPELCRRLERQLDLMDQRPVTLGWIIAPAASPPFNSSDEGPILGTIDELETLMARRKPTPAMALVTLPAAMKDLVAAIRTRLRKLGIADRFVPTLEDQVAGIGPRTHFDIDLTALLNRPARRIDEASVHGVIHGKCVLITGAGGSIGSELARIVARFGPSRLVLVDRSENALFEIDRQIARRHPALPRKAWLHDVVDAPQTRAQFLQIRPQVIFHAAAHKHVPMMEDHPWAAIDNNFHGTRSVADAAEESGAERFVMISTDKAVNPVSIMGATKRLAELYVQWLNRRSQTVFSMVRFGNVLGSSGSVLETWSRQIADGGPLTVTDPRMTRYFMSIPEAAALVIQSAALIGPNSAGEVFMLDMGPPVRILDLARRFIEMHSLIPAVADTPFQLARGSHGVIQIAFTGIRPGEKLFEELAFDAESMRSTKHPDINIWVVQPPDDPQMADILAAIHPEQRSESLDESLDNIRETLLRLANPEDSRNLLSDKDLQQAAA